MKFTRKTRRLVAAIFVCIGFLVVYIVEGEVGVPANQGIEPAAKQTPTDTPAPTGDAAEALERLVVKGKAPKANYARSQFGSGWDVIDGCDVRNIILKRDLHNTTVDDRCRVTSGVLNDPYTSKTILFARGSATSQEVQIDHVVALSNAWQTGAQMLTPAQRASFANDPLELLAVDGESNQQKSDGDAATWLPANKVFRCQYVARQIAVKAKYTLWVTSAEKDAMGRVLKACPGQLLPTQ